MQKQDDYFQLTADHRRLTAETVHQLRATDFATCGNARTCRMGGPLCPPARAVRQGGRTLQNDRLVLREARREESDAEGYCTLCGAAPG